MKKNNIRTVNNVPLRMAIPAGTKPYNIIEQDDDAEIVMYGEVVESRPVDWWTGEPIEGLFIVLNDFLNDLEGLKNKKNITVHVNSIGGDLYAGVAIYNRLKALGNVTTVVDSLAASAASIIAQAAKPGCRKVYESSQIMIHGASSAIWGSYNVQELKDVIKTLEAANETVINVYAETTGKDKDKLKSMVHATTWMSGEKAIENGFADEIIKGEKVTMSMSADKSLLFLGGIPMSARNLATLPQGLPINQTETITTGKEPEVIENQKNEGGIVNMTIQEMREQYPELVNEIERQAIANATNSVTNEAITAERERLQAIEAIENVIGNKELIKNAKYGEKPMTAEQLALQAMQAQAKAGNAFFKDMQEETKAKNGGAEGITGIPGDNPTEPDNEVTDIAKAAALIAADYIKK